MKQWSTALPVCTFLGCPAGRGDLGPRANPGQTLGTTSPRGHGRFNSSLSFQCSLQVRHTRSEITRRVYEYTQRGWVVVRVGRYVTPECGIRST